jgi:hypothetical protein
VSLHRRPRRVDVSADLDALLVHVYLLVDDLLPRRRRFGRPPLISDSELICLAVAQVLLDCPNERRFLRLAKRRWFWGFRLYLLCAPDGLPVGFELAAANSPERVVAAELLERTLKAGQTVIADKGFAGREFEQLVASLGGRLLRPDRKDEPARFGSLGPIRQWIESCFDTLKDQLSLERHGGRTLTGLISRIARRLLALAAAILHNWQTNRPGRSLTAYDH